jgi:DNA-formamidopyrimidine glycosylase
MPEGPEVKKNSSSLAHHISGRDITEAAVISGRYTRNELVGLDDFCTNLPTKAIGVGCHGKFMFAIFNNDYNLWCTFGMTGRWSEAPTVHARFKMGFSDGTQVFFNDIRNFGTLKLVSGKNQLITKLNSLGLDLLSDNVGPKAFLDKIRSKNKHNICKVVMNQSILAGVGNYIKAESLWLAEIDPQKNVGDLEDFELLNLKECIEGVMKSSFHYGGATFLTHKDFSGQDGGYSERFVCYNRKIDADGNAVEKLKTPDGRTTYWAPKRQRG